jgi:hypothetical protein
MTQECILTGRITRLAIFRVPEFGARASFHLECAGRPPAVCAVAGDIARDFIGHYSEGDVVVVSGFHEPRPSTTAANMGWPISGARHSHRRGRPSRGLSSQTDLTLKPEAL